VEFKTPKDYKFPVVMLPGRNDTRPIRRAVDLFRDHAPRQDWQTLCDFMLAAQKEKMTQTLTNILFILEDPSEKDGKVEIGGRSYEMDPRESKVRGDCPDEWVVWFQNHSPPWYRDLLRLHLELWHLKVPDCEDKGNIRTRLVRFARDCGSRSWSLGWDRTTESDILGQIESITVPKRKWPAPDERAIIEPNLCVSWFSQLKEPVKSIVVEALEGVPYDECLPPVESFFKQKGLTMGELEAVLAYINFTYPGMKEYDISAFPSRPEVVKLRLNGRLTPCLLMYRCNTKFSRIPRISRAFGYLDIMGKVDEQEITSGHPLCLGFLEWGFRRTYVFKFPDEGNVIARTWVNSNTEKCPEAHSSRRLDLANTYYLVTPDGTREVSVAMYDRAKKKMYDRAKERKSQ